MIFKPALSMDLNPSMESRPMVKVLHLSILADVQRRRP